MYDVSIAILTFRREFLLRKTIQSCLNQENSLGLIYEIVVVDNCPEGSAQKLVESIKHDSEIPLKYISEPRKNIALARNAAVLASTGNLIAFIDDDEEASPTWLDTMVEVLNTNQADVVFGPVLPEFEGNKPPDWNPNGSYYTRNNLFGSGTQMTVIPGNPPRGFIRGNGGAGNVVFRSRISKKDNILFDPAYGLTGGEDADFFIRVELTGNKLVWCSEGIIHEYVPSDRQTVRYMMRRALNGGQAISRLSSKYGRFGPVSVVKWMTIGFIQLLLWGIPGILLWRSASRFAVRARIKLMGALGKIFWMHWFRFHFY